MPVGIVMNRTDGYRMEPHVIWFPWSSDRNRLECAMKFLHDMRKPPYSRVAILNLRPEDAPFYERIARYNVLRALSSIDDFWGPGQNSVSFQTVRLGDD